MPKTRKSYWPERRWFDTVGRYDEVPIINFREKVLEAKREADFKLRNLIARLREEHFSTEVAFFQIRLQEKAIHVGYVKNARFMDKECKLLHEANLRMRRRAMFKLLHQDHEQYLKELEEMDKIFYNERF